MKGSTGLKKPTPRHPSSLGREGGMRGGGAGWVGIVGRNGLFFSPKDERKETTQTKKNSTWTFKKRRKTNANINTKKYFKKSTHTHSNKRATEIFVSFFLSKCINKQNIV